MFSGSSLSPLAPFRPQGGGRGGFAAAPGLARKSACKTMMGRSPYPLGDARVVRRPGIPSGQRGESLITVVINNTMGAVQRNAAFGGR